MLKKRLDEAMGKLFDIIALSLHMIDPSLSKYRPQTESEKVPGGFGRNDQG